MVTEKTINYGCSDIPLSGKQKDMLGTEKYITGLEKFIEGCCTPMSIALQGDWGTGKTSFINKMMDDFENNNKIITIYFNTWQYSQFNMKDDLYTSFIVSIMNRLKKGNWINEDSTKKILKKVGTIALNVGKQIAESKLDLNLDSVESAILRETEKASMVANLKNDFAELIKECAGDGRIVIFVDDLDRLNPEVAVELLEVMKLFMDVANCVFVLAIDYEVVVKGIRSKYGADMSEAKCRSFFDKIIQLPFRMPVESYTLSELIKSNVGDKLAGYEDIIADVIRGTLGPNPRTFKRLFNAYELLNLVSESKLKEYETALLLISLILQMQSNIAYKILLDATEDKETLEKFKTEYEHKEDIKKDDKESLYEIFEGIDMVGEIAGKNEKCIDIMKSFLNILQLSSITSVNPAGNAKNSATKVNKIEVLGNKFDVANPTEAVVRSFEIIFSEKNTEIEKVLAKYPKMLTTDKNNNSGIFNVKKHLNIKGYEETIILGTKTSFIEKCRQVTRICQFLNLSSGSVKWYNGEEEIFVQ